MLLAHHSDLSLVEKHDDVVDALNALPSLALAKWEYKRRYDALSSGLALIVRALNERNIKL